MAATMKILGKFGILTYFGQNGMQSIPQVLRVKLVNIMPAVYMSTKKHYDPKFRKQRRLKMDMRPIEIFEKQSKYEKMTADQLRIERKKRGEYPPVRFTETQMNIASTNEIVDEYEPPEGDGKKSFLSKEVVNKTKDWSKWKYKNVMHKRTLKKWESGFDKKSIAFELQDIYLEAQKLLPDFRNNKEKLFDYVTEFAYPNMTFGLENKTMRWEFVESIEPPKVVQIRVQPMLTDKNFYSQLTVRMHTRQKLAIYDRFGRLMYGSEHLIKDVLEYVIFEKHIVNEYGRWRVHGKITPTWLPEREPLITTTRKPKHIDKDKTKTADSGLLIKKEKMEESGGGGGPGTPQLATA